MMVLGKYCTRRYLTTYYYLNSKTRAVISTEILDPSCSTCVSGWEYFKRMVQIVCLLDDTTLLERAYREIFLGQPPSQHKHIYAYLTVPLHNSMGDRGGLIQTFMWYESVREVVYPHISMFIRSLGGTQPGVDKDNMCIRKEVTWHYAWSPTRVHTHTHKFTYRQTHTPVMSPNPGLHGPRPSK